MTWFSRAAVAILAGGMVLAAAVAGVTPGTSARSSSPDFAPAANSAPITHSARAANYTTISGSGSSWASVALFQWAQYMQTHGLTVNFNPDGSASGRNDYSQGSQVDFAASDPPFRNGTDELANTGAEAPGYGYSYVPDVGGGTAFMYHVTVGGKLVTNLRLTGATLTKIFTGQITNWDDPAITRDYGAQLPNEPITPVIRSDGSGATFFFTRWMAHVYPQQWDAFCNRIRPGIKQPCPQTEFYPQFGNAKAENGSNNVSTYITSSYGEGSIGYDEYAYALNAHWPIVALANPGGYYVLPTASNVAVALTKAQINENTNSPNFLQQNLDSVYTFTDPRSYPLSSYSYLIVPRQGSRIPPIFSNAKGDSLSRYINYYLCQGQQSAGQLGYSPLPINLVSGGFQQVGRIPGHAPVPNLSSYASCGNPTFVNGVDVLLKDAPYPNACQKVGSSLNCSNGLQRPGQSGSGGGSGHGGSHGAHGSGTAGGHGGKAGQHGSRSRPGAGATASSGTGGTGAAGGTGGTGAIVNPNLTGSVVNVPGNRTDRIMLAGLTATGIAIAVAAPPALAGLRRRRRDGSR